MEDSVVGFFGQNSACSSNDDFMFRPLFEKLSHDLVAVFVARAHKLYASDS